MPADFVPVAEAARRTYRSGRPSNAPGGSGGPGSGDRPREP